MLILFCISLVTFDIEAYFGVTVLKNEQLSFALVILHVNVYEPPNFKHVVICADNTDDKTLLLIKLNTPLATAPIPPAIS